MIKDAINDYPMTAGYVMGLVVSLMLVLFGLWVTPSKSTATNSTIDSTVYMLCQDSRMNRDTTESTCGFLQDQFNREYLCDERNTNPNNHCWVERK